MSCCSHRRGPLNPSDIILLLGPVDPVKIRPRNADAADASANIPPERLLGSRRDWIKRSRRQRGRGGCG